MAGEGLLTMGIKSSNISNGLLRFWKTRERSLWISLSYQLFQYITCRPDQFSQGTGAVQQNCFQKVLYAFPPFCSINRLLHKVWLDQVEIFL